MYNNNEMPYPISNQNLNYYIKEVCKKAEINEIINDQKIEVVEIKLNDKVLKKNRFVKRERPKYEYIASHTGRRTFCMYWYNILDNKDIMKVTGHETEKVFLSYINKTSDTHLKSFKDAFDKDV